MTLGTLFGDTPANRPVGMPIAIVGYLITNIFANVVAGPARAVVADLTPPARLHLANSLVTTSMMISGARHACVRERKMRERERERERVRERERERERKRERERERDR